MCLRRRGVPVGRYVVCVVLAWLGSEVTYGVPCPQEEGENTVLFDNQDICAPGDTCKTACTPQDKNFKCSIHDETGWRQYQTRYRTGYFSLANETGPELVAIAMHHKRYNATGRIYFRPALSITINISAEIRGTSTTPPGNPEALLVNISGVNDSDTVRDDYTDTPLYRLYSFHNYTPTSHDKDYPRQALLKCLDSLDACSKKVYRLEIRAFVPSIRFMTRTVYTITAPNSLNQDLPPVIATALQPGGGGGNVTVLYETGGGRSATVVALVRVNQTQRSYSQFVSSETNRVRFQSVSAGMYTAMIEIAGNNYHSHPFCVGKTEQLDEDCLNTFHDKPGMDDPVGEPQHIIPILAAVLFLLLCTMVAVVLFLYRHRLTRLTKHNHQTTQVVNNTRILLLNRDREQDQRTAMILKDHASKHVPGVKFVSAEKQEAETDIPANKPMMEKAVRSRDHIGVIWSPPDGEEEEDIFEETIKNKSIMTGNRNVDPSVVFSPECVHNTSLPVQFNRARKFDTSEHDSFVQHCFSQSSVSSDSLQDHHTSPLSRTGNGSYTKVSGTQQHKDEYEHLDTHSSCPIHDRTDLQDSNYNIVKSPTETWQYDGQSDPLAFLGCPVHGQPPTDIASEKENNPSLESRFLWLNSNS